MFLHNFIYILSAVTSLVLYLLATQRLHLDRSGLSAAVRDLAEGLGASTFFLGINLALGMAAIFLIRASGTFLALYALQNVVLVVVSVLQGFLFQMWWRRSRTEGRK